MHYILNKCFKSKDSKGSIDSEEQNALRCCYTSKNESKNVISSFSNDLDSNGMKKGLKNCSLYYDINEVCSEQNESYSRIYVNEEVENEKGKNMSYLNVCYENSFNKMFGIDYIEFPLYCYKHIFLNFFTSFIDIDSNKYISLEQSDVIKKIYNIMKKQRYVLIHHAISVPHQKKKCISNYRNGDAMICCDNVIAIADGVSSITNIGINVSHFSNEILRNCLNLHLYKCLSYEKFENQNKRIFKQYNVPYQNTEILKSIVCRSACSVSSLGASTLLFAAIENEKLHVCNIGDCQMLILRLKKNYIRKHILKKIKLKIRTEEGKEYPFEELHSLKQRTDLIPEDILEEKTMIEDLKKKNTTDSSLHDNDSTVKKTLSYSNVHSLRNSKIILSKESILSQKLIKSSSCHHLDRNKKPKKSINENKKEIFYNTLSRGNLHLHNENNYYTVGSSSVIMYTEKKLKEKKPEHFIKYLSNHNFQIGALSFKLIYPPRDNKSEDKKKDDASIDLSNDDLNHHKENISKNESVDYVSSSGFDQSESGSEVENESVGSENSVERKIRRKEKKKKREFINMTKTIDDCGHKNLLRFFEMDRTDILKKNTWKNSCAIYSKVPNDNEGSKIKVKELYGINETKQLEIMDPIRNTNENDRCEKRFKEEKEKKNLRVENRTHRTGINRESRYNSKRDKCINNFNSYRFRFKHQLDNSKFDIIYKSKIQQHYFNCPYQISCMPSNLNRIHHNKGSPKYLNLAQIKNSLKMKNYSDIFTKCLKYCEYSDISVNENDIIVSGSDGLFDNLYDDDIIEIILSNFYVLIQDKFVNLKKLMSFHEAYKNMRKEYKKYCKQLSKEPNLTSPVVWKSDQPDSTIHIDIPNMEKEILKPKEKILSNVSMNRLTNKQGVQNKEKIFLHTKESIGNESMVHSILKNRNGTNRTKSSHNSSPPKNSNRNSNSRNSSDSRNDKNRNHYKEGTSNTYSSTPYNNNSSNTYSSPINDTNSYFNISHYDSYDPEDSSSNHGNLVKDNIEKVCKQMPKIQIVNNISHGSMNHALVKSVDDIINRSSLDEKNSSRDSYIQETLEHTYSKMEKENESTEWKQKKSEEIERTKSIVKMMPSKESVKSIRENEKFIPIKKQLQHIKKYPFGSIANKKSGNRSIKPKSKFFLKIKTKVKSIAKSENLYKQSTTEGLPTNHTNQQMTDERNITSTNERNSYEKENSHDSTNPYRDINSIVGTSKRNEPNKSNETEHDSSASVVSSVHEQGYQSIFENKEENDELKSMIRKVSSDEINVSALTNVHLQIHQEKNKRKEKESSALNELIPEPVFDDPSNLEKREVIEEDPTIVESEKESVHKQTLMTEEECFGLQENKSDKKVKEFSEMKSCIYHSSLEDGVVKDMNLSEVSKILIEQPIECVDFNFEISDFIIYDKNKKIYFNAKKACNEILKLCSIFANQKLDVSSLRKRMKPVNSENPIPNHTNNTINTKQMDASNMLSTRSTRYTMKKTKVDEKEEYVFDTVDYDNIASNESSQKIFKTPFAEFIYDKYNKYFYLGKPDDTTVIVSVVKENKNNLYK